MAKKHQNGSGRQALRQAWWQKSGGKKSPGTRTRVRAGTPKASAPEVSELPSPAEGDRASAERAGAGSDAENQVSLMDQSAAQAEVKGPKPTPSQAEGERSTVDEDLREKGLDSQDDDSGGK